MLLYKVKERIENFLSYRLTANNHFGSLIISILLNLCLIHSVVNSHIRTFEHYRLRVDVVATDQREEDLRVFFSASIIQFDDNQLSIYVQSKANR